MPHDSRDEKLPDDIAELFGAARTDAAPPAGALDRVWEKTMARIDSPPPAPSAPGAGATGLANAVRTAALAGFTAGLLAGAGGVLAVQSFRPEPTPAPPAATIAAVPEAEVTPAATPVAVHTPRTSATPSAAKAVPSPTPISGSHADPLERATERGWLDAARTALDRDDCAGAGDLLERARLRFPEGTLVEEREALHVHVLICHGDDTARIAADTFRTRHAGSLFYPAIERALRDSEANR